MVSKRERNVHLLPNYNIRDYTIDDPEVTYSGEKLDGVPHGYGELVEKSTNKFLYKGEWKNGKRHGKGIEWTVQRYDAWYEGEFYEDFWHGNGIRYYLGNSTKGNFQYNFPYGWVIIRHFENNNEYVYEGTTYGTYYEGYAKLYCNGRLQYVGPISRNKVRHGYGTYYFRNGYIYEGQFIYDDFDGLGELYMYDIQGCKKTLCKGKFKQNIKLGNCLTIYGWNESHNFENYILHKTPDVEFTIIHESFKFNSLISRCETPADLQVT